MDTCRKDGATLNERLIKSNYDYIKAPAPLVIPASINHVEQQLPSSLFSSSSSTTHSHTPPSITDATSSISHYISTHSSLNSLPSLTLTWPNPPFSSSCSPIISPYPSTQCEYRCVATVPLDAHVSSLVSAGDYLYGGSSSSSTINMWLKNDLQKGKIFAQCDANYKVEKLGFNGDGAVRALAAVGLDRIVSAHDHDNKIRVWKMSSSLLEKKAASAQGLPAHHISFKLLTTLPTFKDYLKSFLLASNYVQVRRHHKRLWIEHVDAVSALAVPKGGELLFSASWDRSIKVWRLPDFKCMESVCQAHDDAINCLALSHDGNFVYTGSADTKIKVWAVLSQQGAKKVDHAQSYDRHDGLRRANSKSIRLAHSAVSILKGHKSAVNALALSPDGSVLYSGAGDKAIIVWERREENSAGAEHMVRAGVLRGHRNAILCLVTIARDQGKEEAHMLCSGSADKTIRVWKGVRSCMHKGTGTMNRVQFEYRCVGVLEGHLGPVRCMSVEVSHDDNDDNGLRVHYLLYSASLDTTLKVWRLPVPSF